MLIIVRIAQLSFFVVTAMWVVFSCFLVCVPLFSSGWARESLWREEQRVLAAHRAGLPVTLNREFTWRDPIMKARNDRLRRQAQMAQRVHTMPLVAPDGHVSHLPVRNGRVYIDFDVQRRAMRARQGLPSANPHYQRQEAIRVRLERERAAERHFQAQAALRRQRMQFRYQPYSHEMLQSWYRADVPQDFHNDSEENLKKAIQYVYGKRRFEQTCGPSGCLVHMTHLLQDPHKHLWAQQFSDRNRGQTDPTPQYLINRLYMLQSLYTGDSVEVRCLESFKEGVRSSEHFQGGNTPDLLRSMIYLFEKMYEEPDAIPEDIKEKVWSILKEHTTTCSDNLAVGIEELHAISVFIKIAGGSDYEKALISLTLAHFRRAAVLTSTRVAYVKYIEEALNISYEFAFDQALQGNVQAIKAFCLAGNGVEITQSIGLINSVDSYSTDQLKSLIDQMSPLRVGTFKAALRQGYGENLEVGLNAMRLVSRVLGAGNIISTQAHCRDDWNNLTPIILAESVVFDDETAMVDFFLNNAFWRSYMGEGHPDLQALKERYTDLDPISEEATRLLERINNFFVERTRQALIAAGYFTQDPFYDLIEL